MTVSVNDRQDKDLVVERPEIHGVRKPPKDRPANVAVDARVHRRTLRDLRECRVYFSDEVGAEAGSSRLVPVARLRDLRVRVGTKDDAELHRRPESLRRTTFHGIDELGSAT